MLWLSLSLVLLLLALALALALAFGGIAKKPNAPTVADSQEQWYLKKVFLTVGQSTMSVCPFLKLHTKGTPTHFIPAAICPANRWASRMVSGEVKHLAQRGKPEREGGQDEGS